MARKGQSRERDVARGAALALRRQQLGMTQAQVATRIGVSSQQYGKYERGEDSLDVNRFEDIATVLGEGDHPGLGEASSPYFSAPRQDMKLALNAALGRIDAELARVRALVESL